MVFPFPLSDWSSQSLVSFEGRFQHPCLTFKIKVRKESAGLVSGPLCVSHGVDVMQIFLEVVWTFAPMFISSFLLVAMLRVNLRKVGPFLLQCCVERAVWIIRNHFSQEWKWVRWELSCDKEHRSYSEESFSHCFLGSGWLEKIFRFLFFHCLDIAMKPVKSWKAWASEQEEKNDKVVKKWRLFWFVLAVTTWR